MQDPILSKPVPTLYEWAGGINVFTTLTKLFYEKVLKDPLLGPVFAHMSPAHQKNVAEFIAEVFGGPENYSKDGGSHYQMIQKHLAKNLTEEHRKQWMHLLMQSADEIEMPDDPEFRSAFVAYIEWGTRIAVLNSNETHVQMNPDEEMPVWGWGVPGGPFVK